MKHKLVRLNRYTAGAALLIAGAAVSTVIIVKHNRTDAAPQPKVTPTVSTTSEFSFSGATSWWQGATNKTSMALFHDSHDCFVSVEHKAGTVDAAAELQKSQGVLTSGGYTVTPVSAQTLTVQTATGPQKYKLYQSAVATPKGAHKVEGGQEFGYLQLSNGYLKIMGYCDTPDELPATLPALQAIKYDK